jgi:hypothetical protein
MLAVSGFRISKPIHTFLAAKRAKLSPASVPSQPVSVIEARRNVQSTEQLVAALGMDKFLSSSVDKKVESVAQSNGLTKVRICVN